MSDEKYDGPERRNGKEDRRAKDWVFQNRWKLLSLWIAAFSVVVGLLFVQNGRRVDDIQQARLASCERTYEGIREVFRPFFPVDPVTGEPLPEATDEQIENLNTFNATIKEKKAQCGKQTQVVTTNE